MSVGIVEVITLLLGMSGFGLQANPRPPTADQALVYAMADADLAAHIDAASIVPGNYKLLGQLADQPQIRSSPELQQLVQHAIGEIEGGRGVAKLATGIDVTTDIADATAFLRIVPRAEPVFVVAVHGKFSTANLDKIARSSSRSAAPLGTGTIVEGSGHDPAIALTRDGVLLIGTRQLIHDRLADGWRPPSHAAGTNLGYLADAISAKPVLAVVLTMSQAARSEALAHLGAESFATDLVTRHKAAAFSIFHDGLGWTWVDSTRTGLDNMELVSNGVLDVLRASQIAPRGMAKIALGAIDSYRGKSPQLDQVIAHKADLMKLIEAYTGNGSFKVASDKNPSTLRLNVRATGKSVSEVLPLGVLVPLGVLGYFVELSEAVPPPMMIPQPAAKPAQPTARPPQPTARPAPAAHP